MTATGDAAAPLPRARHRRSVRRDPFAALLGYTLRACVPTKRRLLLLVPALATVGFGALATTGGGDRATTFAEVSALALFSLVLPLTCLVLGDAVLGAEVRSGTFALTWLSPVPFRSIVLARWLGGWSVATACLVPAGAVAAVVAGVPGAAGATALALAGGAGAYVALFLVVGVVTKRTAVWSIALVLIVERLVGTALSAVAQLSPMWLAHGVVAGLAPDPAGTLERSGVPAGWSALGRLALVTAALLALAVLRMPRIRLTGPAD